MPDSIDPRETAQRWISANTDLRDPDISTSAVRGTTSTTLRITAAGSQSLVLKLYDAPGLVEAIPDIAEREALGLQLAGKTLGDLVPGVLVATPRASDGLPPGLLMTAVQGTDNVRANQLEGPLGVMARLHEASCAGLPDLYPPWADLDAAHIPEWTTSPDRWKIVLDLLDNGPSDRHEVFLHRDFQPANLLWNDSTLTGLVDWTFACRGPASLDLAHYRMNLALLHGLDIAEQAKALYQQLRPDHDHDPWWDITELLAVAANPEGVASGFAGAGIAIELQTITDVCDAFATSITSHT